MIRYTIALKLKMGCDKYKFLSKIFCMPCSKTLDVYSNVSVRAPGGILFDTLHVQRKTFETKNGDDLEEPHWYQHGSLAWNSMTTKEKLEYNTHSMRIFGFADDAFDLDIIKRELADRISDETNPDIGPTPMAKKYILSSFLLLGNYIL